MNKKGIALIIIIVIITGVLFLGGGVYIAQQRFFMKKETQPLLPTVMPTVIPEATPSVIVTPPAMPTVTLTPVSSPTSTPSPSPTFSPDPSLVISLSPMPTSTPVFKEQDFPEILTIIKDAKLQVNQASIITTSRSSSIALDDCNHETCFLSALRISQDNSHLDCNGKTIKPKNNAEVALIIEANNFSITNCRIESFKNAIKILGSGNIIFNNTIINNPEGGIIIEGNSNLVFNNSMKDNRKFNVHIQAMSKNNIVYNNTMIDTEGLYRPYTGAIAAISVSGSENKILENTIKNNAEIGIRLIRLTSGEPAPSKNLVAKNQIENSGVLALGITGAVPKKDTTDIPETKNSLGRNTVFNNTLSKSNKEFGISVEWSDNNAIIGNNVYENNWEGIHIFSSDDNTIQLNQVYKNKDEGIWLGNAHNNNLFSNIIFDNVHHCGITLTNWKGDSTNNTVRNNFIDGNGNMHDDGQICDDDNNLVYENEFK